MFQINPLLLEEKRVDLIKFANKNMSKRDILNATKGFRKVTDKHRGSTRDHLVYNFSKITKSEVPYRLTDLLSLGKDHKMTRAMINMGSGKV